jgi:uncharacterized protein YidB (DUF937 family)
MTPVWERTTMGDLFSGRGGGGITGNLPGGLKMAAIALLVQQLMKHAGSQQSGAAPAGQAGAQPDAQSGGQGGGIGDILGGLLRGGQGGLPGGAGQGGGGLGGVLGGGGLGGLLGGLLGGGGQGGGGGMAGGLGGNAGLGGLLGGLAGMLGGMRRQGFSEQVDSWVSPGANQPIDPRALEQSFDPQDLDDAAREAGTDRQQLLEELSRTLPEVVDRMTPQGQVPQREEELGQGGVGELLGSLLRPRNPPQG